MVKFWVELGSWFSGCSSGNVVCDVGGGCGGVVGGGGDGFWMWVAKVAHKNCELVEMCGAPGVRQCLWGVKVGVKCEMGVKKSEIKFGEVGVLRWGYLRGLVGIFGEK